MKNYFTVVLAVVLAFLGSSAALGNETVITGYGPREFAVKGEVQRELDSFAEILKHESSDASNEGSTLNLYLEGGADKTGDTGRNDDYGLSRAKSAEAYLYFRLPNAIVKSWSAGNAPDARQVKARWEWIKSVPAQTQVIERVIEQVIIEKPVPVPAQAAESEPPAHLRIEPTTGQQSDDQASALFLPIVLIGGLFFAFLLYFFLWKRKKERDETAAAKAANTGVGRWPSDFHQIAGMYVNKIGGEEGRLCGCCSAKDQIKGRNYVRHLTDAGACKEDLHPNPLKGLTNRQAGEMLRQEVNHV